MSEQANESQGGSGGFFKSRLARRIFAIVSIVLSVLAILLSVVALAGTWIGRGVVIDLSGGVLDGIGQLAQVGREGAGRVDGRLEDLRGTVGTVQAGVDQLAGSVRDKGLILTLLPPEIEQELEATAQEVAAVFREIKAVLDTARGFVRTIDRLPFVDLPQPDPDRVAEIEAGLDSARSGAQELADDVHQFREDAAADISKVSEGAARVDGRLGEAQDDLAALDSRLSELQTGADVLKRRLATWITVAAVVLTLLFAWVIYALVSLILRAWADLRA